MSKRYNLADIVLSASINYYSIVDVTIDHVRNRYAEAKITVKADGKEIAHLSVGDEPTAVAISGRIMDENSSIVGTKELFHGYCYDFKAKEGYSDSEITIYAYGLCSILDRQKKEKVFQGFTTLKEITDEITKDYASLNIQVDPSAKVNPVEYQHLETDWEFIRRLAARNELSIYEDKVAMEPTIFIGKVVGGAPGEVDLDYKVSDDVDIDEYIKILLNVPNADVGPYYFGTENYESTTVEAGAGHSFGRDIVFESHIFSKNAIVYNDLKIAKKLYDRPEYMEMEISRGTRKAILFGNVVKVEGSRVQIKFFNEILKGEPVWIPYESRFSNYFYCMPDEGDFVATYFQNDGTYLCIGSFHTPINYDEKDKKAVEERLSYEDFLKPGEKVFNNENEVIKFLDKAMEFTANREGKENKDAHSTIYLDKEEGITIESTGDVIVKGCGPKGDISIENTKDGKIEMKAGSAINMKVGNNSVKITENQIDVKGTITKLDGSTKQSGYSKIKGTSNIARTESFAMHAKGEGVNVPDPEELRRQVMNGDRSPFKGEFAKYFVALKDVVITPTKTKVVNTQTPPVEVAVAGNTEKETKTVATIASGKDATQEECAGDPINVVTGSMSLHHVDMLVRYTGGEFEIARSYESVHKNDGGVLGSKWLSVFNESLHAHEKHVDVLLDELHLEKFHKNDGKLVSARTGDESVSLQLVEDIYYYEDKKEKSVRTFDRDGKLLSKMDQNKNGFKLIYENGQLDRAVFTGGSAIRFGFEEKKLSYMKDDLGRTVSYFYEGSLLTKVTCMDGKSIKYAYDAKGNLTQITDQNGKSYVQNVYDRKGRVVRQMISSGEEFVIFYDEVNRQNSFTSAATGERIIYTYDARRLPLKTIYDDGTFEETVYDKWENIICERDRKGNETVRSYSEEGKLLEETMPNGLCCCLAH